MFYLFQGGKGSEEGREREVGREEEREERESRRRDWGLLGIIQFRRKDLGFCLFDINPSKSTLAPVACQ
jgi:hypothetical protein